MSFVPDAYNKISELKRGSSLWGEKMAAFALAVRDDIATLVNVGLTNLVVYSVASPTSAVDIQLTAADARRQRVNMTADAKAILLPDATTFVGGMPCHIENVGVYSFDVKNFSGSVLLAGLAPGQIMTYVLADGGTSAGVWQVVRTGVLDAIQNWDKPQIAARRDLGDITGDVILDFASAQDFTATTTGNITLANPAGIAAAVNQKGAFTIDNSAGHTLIGAGTYWKSVGDVGAPEFPTGQCRFDWHVCSATRIEYVFKASET